MIPLKQAGKLLLVEVQIGELQGNLILDTGAPYLVLNSTYFRELQGNDSFAVAGLGGAETAAERSVISSLKIGDLEYKNVSADLVSLGHLENKRQVKILGLLGLAQLSEFIVELDLQSMQLVLRKKSVQRSQPPQISAPLTLSKNCIHIGLSCANTNLTFSIDTGAETNVVSSDVPSAVLAQLSIQRRTVLTSSVGQDVEVLFGTLSGFTVDETYFGFVPVILTNLEQLGEVYKVKIDGMLGYDFLSRGKVVLDFQSHQFDMYLYE